MNKNQELLHKSEKPTTPEKARYRQKNPGANIRIKIF